MQNEQVIGGRLVKVYSACYDNDGVLLARIGVKQESGVLLMRYARITVKDFQLEVTVDDVRFSDNELTDEQVVDFVEANRDEILNLVTGLAKPFAPRYTVQISLVEVNEEGEVTSEVHGYMLDRASSDYGKVDDVTERLVSLGEETWAMLFDKGESTLRNIYWEDEEEWEEEEEEFEL